MSFLSAAECGASSNPLNQLLKQSQTDRSLQHGDRMQQQQGGPQSNAFRQSPGPGGAGGEQLDANFMRHQQAQFGAGGAGGASTAFDFQQMRKEMEMMRASGAPPPSSAAWANEMSARASPASALGLNARPVAGGSAWGNQFQQQQHQQPMTASPSMAQQQLGPGPDSSSSSYMSRMAYGGFGGGGAMMGGFGGGGMMSSYAPQSQQSQPQQQQDKGKSRNAELSDNASWEAQFKALDDAQAAAEAEAAAASSTTTDKGKGKARDTTEEDQDAAVRRALDGITDEITAEGREADDRFQELWNAMKHSTAGDQAEVDEDLAKWEEELNKQSEGVGYRHPGGGIAGGDGGLLETAGWDGTEDHLLDGFGTIGPNGYPRLGTYNRSAQNPYMTHADPLAEGLRLLSSGGSLTDATMAFEAATVKPQTGGTGGEAGEVDRERRARSEAWRRLGEAQAMNERENQAIRALEEAIRVDEGNLEAYMALAISYINEGYDVAAFSTLQRYIQRAYPHLGQNDTMLPDLRAVEPENSKTNPWATLNAATDSFLTAARENAARNVVDAEVQVGLGVLFYADSSYDKAEDCFRSALSVRPNDFLLWNRLGATLANGGKSVEAIEAYHKALELRPTFTRAIYNLSVSCLNLGAHHQAAEHLLSALALQQTQTLPDVPAELGAGGGPAAAAPLAQAQESHGLWSTLRRIFLAMDRMDLAGKAHVGSSLEQFKGEFDF